MMVMDPMDAMELAALGGEVMTAARELYESVREHYLESPAMLAALDTIYTAYVAAHDALRNEESFDRMIAVDIWAGAFGEALTKLVKR